MLRTLCLKHLSLAAHLHAEFAERLNVITGEYSSNRWRSAAISMQATGYPIGATIGGIIAAWLIVRFGWRSVFLFGGVVSALMIPFGLVGKEVDSTDTAMAPGLGEGDLLLLQ